MPNTTTFTASIVIDGDEYTQRITNTSNVEVVASPSVPAAKAGSLTTRTDSDTGTLTMAGGHGFADADKVDVFWNGGSRRNMTVGTVATNSVPVDGGSGDNLPDAATAITAMKPTQVTFAVTGDDVEALGSHCPVSGWVVYRNGTTVLLAHQILPNLGGGKVWAAGNGVTNPLAGVSPTNVLFSHNDSTQAQTMRAAVAH